VPKEMLPLTDEIYGERMERKGKQGRAKRNNPACTGGHSFPYCFLLLSPPHLPYPMRLVVGQKNILKEDLQILSMIS